jgi:hypothetical protein
MISTHVLIRSGLGVRSPVDGLCAALHRLHNAASHA